jgi:hypothetical protein
MTIKHGDRVKCKIEGKQIDDAKISIGNGEYSGFYLNQNVTGPHPPLFGYKNAWNFKVRDDGRYTEGVTDIVIISNHFEKYKKRFQESVRKIEEKIV